MAKENMVKTTENIIKLATDGGCIRKCVKLQMDNIIFSKFEEMGLLGMIFRQNIRTKEQPNGCIYDENTYQVVMRVISGRLLMTGNQPDVYTWKCSKVENSKKISSIGTNSKEGIINLSKMINSIEDEKEKELFAEMFTMLKSDLLLVTSEEEERLCIEVDSNLYAKGVTYCIDEWMALDENGNADVTNLNIGDFLIVSKHFDSLYCIRKQEFLETHKLV